MAKHLLCVIGVMLMWGCGSSPDDYDPSILPTQVTFSLVADDMMNRYADGESTPVEIKIFEMKDDSMLMSADYDLITEDYKEALKSNFVEIYEYVLTPGQFKFIAPFELDEDTHYIGVIAHFSDTENSDWKKAVKVLNLGRRYHLLMHFKESKVKLERVE